MKLRIPKIKKVYIKPSVSVDYKTGEITIWLGDSCTSSAPIISSSPTGGSIISFPRIAL